MLRSNVAGPKISTPRLAIRFRELRLGAVSIRGLLHERWTRWTSQTYTARRVFA